MVKQLQPEMAQTYFVDIRKCKSKPDGSAFEALAAGVQLKPYVAARFLHPIQMTIEHYFNYILSTREESRQWTRFAERGLWPVCIWDLRG